MCARTLGRPDFNRLRVRFGKDGRLAYLGHLEVLNTIMRSVRRAQLPFLVGNGFAQRMRIQFSQALPVGAASTCEYFDLFLVERVDAAEALARLKVSTPPALAPVEARYVGSRLPALEAWLTRSDWTIRLLGDNLHAEAIDTAIRELQGIGSIDFMRGEKARTIGLDDTLVDWELHDAGSEGAQAAVDMRLYTRSSNLGALRPAVLLEAAFKRPALEDAALDSMRVLRDRQWHEGEGGAFLDPMADEFAG